MLRITVQEDACCLTFQLEGRLAGRWVQELKECWQRTAATQQKRVVRVDLAGVTFVDAEGQACLVALHGQGAELVAVDCLTKAVVDEITQGQPPNSTRPK
jgi:anti-anti-sigma regulatory factor